MTTLTESTPLSPTQLERLACRRYFYHSYLDPNYADEILVTQPLQRGRDVHEIIAEYSRHLKDAKRDTDWTWMEKRLADYTSGSPENILEVRQLCQQFAETDILDPQHTLVEWPIAARRLANGGYKNCEYDDPLAVFRGRPDRLILHGTSAQIVDFKTSWRIPPLEELGLAPQTLVYSCLVLIAMPQLTSVQMTYRYVRYGLAERTVTVESDDLRQHMANLEIYLSARNRAIGALQEGLPYQEVWPAQPCELCQWCYFPCEVKTALVQRDMLPMPTNAVEAGRIADFLVLAEIAIKQAKEVLRGWCDAHGYAQGRQATFGYTQVQERHYPLTWLLEHRGELTRLGVDFNALRISGIAEQLKVRKRRSKSGEADTPESAALKEALIAGAETIVKTRFQEVRNVVLGQSEGTQTAGLPAHSRVGAGQPEPPDRNRPDGDTAGGTDGS